MIRKQDIPKHLQELTDPVYDRLWKEVRKKYRGAGGVGRKVTVRLSRLQQEECEKIPVLLVNCAGRLKLGGELKTTLTELELELGKHPYYIDLKGWFEILDGRELLTSKEEGFQARSVWEGLFYFALGEKQQVTESGYPQVIIQWLFGLMNEDAEGYRTLKEILRTGTSDIASGMLRECADALTELWSMQSASGASSGMRLPVLADRFTGDPHALDWNRKQGRLFFYGIREIWSRRLDWTEKEVAEDGWDELYIGASTNQEEEEQADDIIKPPVWSGRQSLELRMVYRMAGVLDDDVSSQVLVWGRPFSESHGVALTLHQVEEWTCWPKQGNIYIVENPSVFSSLLDAACNYKDRKHANEEEKLLVCWSGQPSAAAVLLLDCLHNRMEAASRFFYSGDFDVNGLAIANFAANRYKERFQAWKMDGATYEQYVRPKKAFTDQERTKLKKAQYTWDSTLGYRMDDNGYKCFQESILPLLLREWIE